MSLKGRRTGSFHRRRHTISFHIYLQHIARAIVRVVVWWVRFPRLGDAKEKFKKVGSSGDLLGLRVSECPKSI